MVQSFNTTGNLFQMTKCKNTLNLCLFVFCLFLWLVGCGFFCAVTHVGTHSGGVMMSLACTYQPAAPHLEQTGRQRGQSQDFEWVVVFWFLFVFCFFPRPAHHTCQVKTVVPHRHLLRYVPIQNESELFQQFCYVKESLHFLSDKILALLFN